MRTAIAAHELLPEGLHLESLSIGPGCVGIRVASGTRSSRCPLCGRGASRVHSRYSRTVSDLPWHGNSVQLEVRARRFFCDDPSCERTIFCERLPEVAARDRSHIYREALAKGAPGAVQVTDRWHLLHNLAHVLEDFLLQKQPILREAAMPGTEPEEKGDGTFGSGPIMPNRPRNHDRKIEEAARKRHERLVRQWEDIRRLYLAGADLRHICRELDISARTVYRYKDLAEPPPRRAHKRRASVLDPYVPYLVRRWTEGCRNGKRLYREIRERGYANSEEICARFTAQLRRAASNGKPPSSVPRARKSAVAGLSPTSKNVAALFMRREEKLNGEQKEYLGRLCEADGALADARRLTQEFNGMVRNLEGEKLDGWLEEAEACGAPAMRRFATGLRKDLPAVRAGLTEPWSNGPVEGFVHKLKLLKRQGYGRAGFELLKARMLAA